MKKHIIWAAFFLVLACNSYENEKKEIEFLENPLLKADIVKYPLSSSVEGLDQIRWGLFPEDQKADAKATSREITTSAITLAYKLLNNHPHIRGNEDKFIADSRELFTQQEEMMPHVLLAKQMVGLQIQAQLFDQFLYEDDLQGAFGTLPLEDSELQLLEYGTSLLIESGNPNADISLLNLSLLSDHADPTLIKRHAEQSIKNAKRWYDLDATKTKDCHQCNEKPSAEEKKIDIIRHSVLELQKMLE